MKSGLVLRVRPPPPLPAQPSMRTQAAPAAMTQRIRMDSVMKTPPLVIAGFRSLACRGSARLRNIVGPCDAHEAYPRRLREYRLAQSDGLPAFRAGRQCNACKSPLEAAARYGALPMSRDAPDPPSRRSTLLEGGVWQRGGVRI